MKPVKAFGLAMIATVATIAFVGAGSASAAATLLCNQHVALGACTEPTQHVHLVATNPEILTSFGNIKCESVLLLAEVLGLGEPQVLHGNRTYLKCELGGSACTEVTETSAGVLINILRTGEELGEATSRGRVKIICSGLECEFEESSEHIGHWLGPSLTGDGGHITYTKAKDVKVGGGILCPSSTLLDALFVSLTRVYLNS